jgi:hypothetical protein
MIALIDQIRLDKDSIGGVVECVARNVPKGLGEPVFDKLEADLAKWDDVLTRELRDLKWDRDSQSRESFS